MTTININETEIKTMNDTQLVEEETQPTATTAKKTMENTQVIRDNTITLTHTNSTSEQPILEQTIQSLAEGSTGFFNVIKPKVPKKISDCNASELREFIRIKLFPRKDGLITVYTTLAGITPLLIAGEKSFQVQAITKEEALETILAIPKHILDSILLIAQSEYVSTKKHAASEESKKKRKESKALQALAKRKKIRDKTADINLETALFEAKKLNEYYPADKISSK